MATHAIIPGTERFTSGPRNDSTNARAVPLWLNPDEIRPTQYLVYLHTISRRSFEQPSGIYGNVIIPACPKEKKSHCFMTIEHPKMLRPVVDPNNASGNPLPVYENGIRVALSILNPSFPPIPDLGLQDKPLPPEAQLSSGECDLVRQGVFASLNAEPTEEEIKKAEDRRLAFYKKIFAQANELARTDPKKLSEVLTIDHHLAADMFGQDVSWHLQVTPKIECPNCGDKIKEGIAFHFSNGTRCILDWKRAYLAGAVKKEDVPPSHRWQGFGKVEE